MRKPRRALALFLRNDPLWQLLPSRLDRESFALNAMLRGHRASCIGERIARRHGGGEVIIRGRAEDDQLRLEIVNTGVLDVEGAGCGVGLQNIRERLRLLYGHHGTFSLTENRKGQVHAVVVFPLHKAVLEDNNMPLVGLTGRVFLV